MTPAKVKQLYGPGLVEKYLKETDKVLFIDILNASTQDEKDGFQRLIEAEKWDKVTNVVRKARKTKAQELAIARLDEIIADGCIAIADELDELV